MSEIRYKPFDAMVAMPVHPKFKQFAQAAVVVPVALTLVPYRSEALGPHPDDMSEDGHQVRPLVQPVAFGGRTHTLSNGTGTRIDGTNTHYFWPIPR
jgi:hypothetical protein